jgi:mannose-6-phosphate isomerase
VIKLIQTELVKQNFKIVEEDQNRPWGGFFVISEEQSQIFANKYFNGLDVTSLKISGKLSPKILVVAPNMRLSWQYHHRRAEIWRVVHGIAGVIRSHSDFENSLEILKIGESITLMQGERHRLVGLDDYAVIAEIWRHTDVNNPSDEDDIVRLQDDFGR